MMIKKIPFIQILVLFILLSVNLSSCTTVPAITPNVTITSPTKTPVPTEKPTATPTEDPLADAPKGTTGFDENGDPIMKSDDGFTYHWDEQLKLWSDERGWFPAFETPFYDSIPVVIKISSDVLGGSFIKNVSFIDNDDPANSDGYLIKSLIAEANITYFSRIYGVERSELDVNDIPEVDRLNLGNQISQKSVEWEIVGSDGKTYEASIGLNSGFITTIVNFESLNPEEDTSVFEFFDSYKNVYRYKTVGVDDDGNVIGVIASKKSLSDLSKTQLLHLFLYHPTVGIKFANYVDKGLDPLVFNAAENLSTQDQEFITIAFNK